MTADQVWWEYRQIIALEYERKTGKPYNDSEEHRDPEYEEWQQRMTGKAGEV